MLVTLKYEKRQGEGCTKSIASVGKIYIGVREWTLGQRKREHQYAAKGAECNKSALAYHTVKEFEQNIMCDKAKVI